MKDPVIFKREEGENLLVAVEPSTVLLVEEVIGACMITVVKDQVLLSIRVVSSMDEILTALASFDDFANVRAMTGDEGGA